MRKSPGRWIKNVLFGKKTSKLNFAKGKEKFVNEREVHVRVRTPENGKDFNRLEVESKPVNVDDHNLTSERSETLVSQKDEEIPVSGNQEEMAELDMRSEDEIIAQERAAMKAQAAFRGFLARRAFKALKGIIRLQALIRGHLVRRQAVSTLYCMMGIVKLQALVRGSRIRRSDAGLQDGKIELYGDGVYVGIPTLSANAFIKKLLAPSPTVMPLRVHYEETDPNSIHTWLERWSVSCPWKPKTPPKKVVNTKPQKKPGNSHAVEVEPARPKHSVRKVPSLYDSISGQSNSELEKPRRNLKKITSHPADSIQENPQNELEKVKRSLRKVCTPATTESSINQEVSFPTEVNPVEKAKEETGMIIKEETTATNIKETGEEPIQTDEPENISSGYEEEKLKSFEGEQKDENTPVPNSDDFSNEYQQSGRRASFPAKQEHVENGVKLPSYMQATESAKAKLKAQGSPRVVSDEGEKNNFVPRRYSLPSSTNGKVSSVSPRVQKPVQGGRKSGGKSEKSLLPSRDGSGGKAGQTQWRR